MSKKSKFYDIVPKEKKSIRNIPIPEKSDENEDEERIIESHELKRGGVSRGANKNAVKKHDHNESSSVEIRKLARPITNVEEYDNDEYIEIIDHTTSDNETTEEVHMLGENKEEIEKNKIPALAETENEDFTDYTKSTGRSGGGDFLRNIFRGSFKLPAIILIVLVVGFLALSSFNRASVVLKTEDIKVSLDSGYKFDQGDGEILQSTSTDSISVPASGSSKVDKKSTGTVVIFNNTTASQKFTKGTKLQASNGLIYLLDKAVTVPAKKTVSKKIVLGSVTTTVTADVSGEKYNSGPKDFTFPSLKGTTKFDTIYGRSKGSITGGYTGDVPNISQKDLAGQIAEARDKMKDKLLLLLKQQADSRGLVINNETLQYKIINSETRLSADKKLAVVKVDGTLQAGTLLNASIVEAAKSILGVEDGNGFKYEVSLASSALEISNATSSDEQMTATGNIDIKVTVNKDELARTIENKGKRAALSLLQQTNGVTFAQIKLSPFWSTTLPKATGITILVQD
jgi:hypothetical protein